MHPSPFDLRIDAGGDQFPVAGSAPRLSWKPPAGGETREYELEAEVDGRRLDAVRAPASAHRFTAWPWGELSSGQRVRWRVRAHAADSASPWSEWSAFEIGLLARDWTANWISPAEDADPGPGKRPAWLLSTEFDVDRTIVSARLYATALGVYEAFVNGRRVGTTELAPGSTSYDLTLYAQAYDLTDLVRDGGNELAFLLSDGWYRGQVGAFRIPARWGERTGVRAELHLAFADGARRVVRTDGTWGGARSALTRADLMDGQTTDQTEQPGKASPVLVDRVGAPPAVEWSPAPPVRVVETRAPVSVRQTRDDAWVVDFGQNASGWVRLSDLGPAGTRTVVEYGEHVGPDGDLSTSHLDSQRPGERIVFVQRDEVVSDGSGTAFEPRHTVHGFQYARVTRDGAPLDPDGIRQRIVHTDLRRTGAFASSSDDLNRLHDIADWSFRGNAVDVPTDCPTRERLAWTGDYQVFAPAATRLYDVLGFSRKWLRSVRDDQLPDGRIANFSPDGRRIKIHLDDQLAMMTGSSGWGDAIVAVPWELYETYGDREALAENWEAARRWVEWALENARTARHSSRVRRSAQPSPHERFVWDGSFHWGEWTEPRKRRADGTRIDPIADNPAEWFTADKGETGTAYLHRSTSTLARIARLLGHDADAGRYERLAAQILDAWQIEFLAPDGRTAVDTQASYVRALSFGLIPESLRAAAAERLVELIRRDGTHLGTGFLATGDLLPVLVEHGHADVAYELLFQRTAPSWLYMVDKGATTIWEDWEGIDEHGVAHGSLNHYSKGAVVRFLHTHVLGLRQAAGSVAWDAFLVAPVPGGGLTWAKGSHESPQGTIAAEWRIERGDLRITVDVPPATTATIVHPDGTTRVVEPGTHTVSRPWGAEATSPPR